MENQLMERVFDYKGTKVRTTVINGEPWFVAKDVCEVLGIRSNNMPYILKNVPGEMKGRTQIATPGGPQRMTCVNEPGLYRLIMRSDKPEALQFQNWIASEVLPSIRKNGMYMTPAVAREVIDDPELFIARALLLAKEKIDRLEAALNEAKPKAKHFDEYMDTAGTHAFSDIAALLGIHVRVLTTQLETDGVLRRNIKGELYPRKAYLDTGYFQVKHAKKYIHTRLTPEGVQWITTKYAFLKQRGAKEVV